MGGSVGLMISRACLLRSSWWPPADAQTHVSHQRGKRHRVLPHHDLGTSYDKVFGRGHGTTSVWVYERGAMGYGYKKKTDGNHRRWLRTGCVRREFGCSVVTCSTDGERLIVALPVARIHPVDHASIAIVRSLALTSGGNDLEGDVGEANVLVDNLVLLAALAVVNVLFAFFPVARDDADAWESAAEMVDDVGHGRLFGVIEAEAVEGDGVPDFVEDFAEDGFAEALLVVVLVVVAMAGVNPQVAVVSVMCVVVGVGRSHGERGDGGQRQQGCELDHGWCGFLFNAGDERRIEE